MSYILKSPLGSVQYNAYNLLRVKNISQSNTLAKQKGMSQSLGYIIWIYPLILAISHICTSLVLLIIHFKKLES